MTNAIDFLDAYLKGKADGRKEVVEWLQSHCKGYHKGNYGGEYGHFGIYRSEFKAKLKEWEI